MMTLKLCANDELIHEVTAEIPNADEMPTVIFFAGQLFTLNLTKPCTYDLANPFDVEASNFPPRMYVPDEVAAAVVAAQHPVLSPIRELEAFGSELARVISETGGTSAGVSKGLRLQPFMLRAWLKGIFVPVGTQLGELFGVLPKPLNDEVLDELEALRLEGLEAVAIQAGRVLSFEDGRS